MGYICVWLFLNHLKLYKILIQDVPKTEDKSGCLLCRKSEGSKCSQPIGTSENTFAEVLSKLFHKERLPTKLDEKAISKELLCRECRVLVEEVFKLQHELREKKNIIVNMFIKSQNISYGREEKTNSESEKSKKENKKHKKRKKQGEKEDKEIFIIESLLEKKGDKYLVKWENYSKEYDSWEPASSVPNHIVQVKIYFTLFLNHHFTSFFYSIMKMI